MNHTERIQQVAREVRGLTRDLAREAVERYLASVANELSQGEWVTLPTIGRLRIIVRRSGGQLQSRQGNRTIHQPEQRLQTCLRLSDDLKARSRQQIPMEPGRTRNETGKLAHYPFPTRKQYGKEK